MPAELFVLIFQLSVFSVFGLNFLKIYQLVYSYCLTYLYACYLFWLVVIQ